MTGSAGKPKGLATLDSSGKLAQMPTAADVGALTADAIASGNNSNGSWIKFKGGMLLQWGSTAIGAIATGGHVTVGFDFPTAFVAKPVVIPMPRIDAAQSLTVHHGNANSNNSGAYCYVHNDSGSTVSGAELGWIAIGRWQ